MSCKSPTATPLHPSLPSYDSWSLSSFNSGSHTGVQDNLCALNGNPRGIWWESWTLRAIPDLLLLLLSLQLNTLAPEEARMAYVISNLTGRVFHGGTAMWRRLTHTLGHLDSDPWPSSPSASRSSSPVTGKCVEPEPTYLGLTKLTPEEWECYHKGNLYILWFILCFVSCCPLKDRTEGVSDVLHGSKVFFLKIPKIAIKNVISTEAVQLKLPWSMQVHPTFHVSKRMPGKLLSAMREFNHLSLLSLNDFSLCFSVYQFLTDRLVILILLPSPHQIVCLCCCLSGTEPLPALN